MAKDNRQGKGRSRQVSLTQKAGNTSRHSRKKSGVPVGKIVLAVLGVGLVIAGVFFGITAWKFVNSFFSSSGEQTEAPTPYEGESTVAYYVFGMFGEDETSDLEMLSLVCYDKAAKTVNILQIPSATYLGDSEKWSVSKVGSVWANPKPLDWCNTCRRSVYESEIADGRHDADTEGGSYCGAPITQMDGSAEKSLLEVFNHQYTISPDNYYLMPQAAFSKMVDWVGGIDVELESDMTLAETSYSAGVQTLAGEAALEYMLDDADTVTAQVENLLHQRKVFAALFERLFSCEREYLDDEVLWPVMKGSSPIRTRRDNQIADDITLMIDLVQELSTVPRESITVYMLPGEAVSYDGENYYSVHKEALASLLNEAFNPDGEPIAAEHLKMTELANTTEDDLHRQTMAELLVAQQGQLTEEEE